MASRVSDVVSAVKWLEGLLVALLASQAVVTSLLTGVPGADHVVSVVFAIVGVLALVGAKVVETSPVAPAPPVPPAVVPPAK